MRFYIADDNDREGNIKVYNDEWIWSNSFSPRGSHDGILDGPQHSIIMDGNLVVYSLDSRALLNKSLVLVKYFICGKVLKLFYHHDL